jgi:hypothetical protein
MPKERPDIDRALIELREWFRERCPHLRLTWVACELVGENTKEVSRLAVPGFNLSSGDDPPAFIPNDFQEAILNALEGKALRARALGREVGDTRRLYRHPGGIKELEEQDWVRVHPRLGYYRPDAAPAELQERNEPN